MAGGCGVVDSYCSKSEKTPNLGEMFKCGFLSDNMNGLLKEYETSGEVSEGNGGYGTLNKAYDFFEKAEEGEKYLKKLTQNGRMRGDGSELLETRTIVSNIMEINHKGRYFLDLKHIYFMKEGLCLMIEGKRVPRRTMKNLQEFFGSLSKYTVDETGRLINH